MKEKIETLIKRYGLSQKEFAKKIGVNHIVFNRNMMNGNITAEIMKAIIIKLPEVDFNWLFKDEENKMSSEELINEMILRFHLLRKMSQK